MFPLLQPLLVLAMFGRILRLPSAAGLRRREGINVTSFVTDKNNSFSVRSRTIKKFFVGCAVAQAKLKHLVMMFRLKVFRFCSLTLSVGASCVRLTGEASDVLSSRLCE